MQKYNLYMSRNYANKLHLIPNLVNTSVTVFVDLCVAE